MHNSVQKTDDVVKKFVATLKDNEFHEKSGKYVKPQDDRPVVEVEQLDRLPRANVKKEEEEEEEEEETETTEKKKSALSIALKYLCVILRKCSMIVVDTVS